MYFFKLSRSAKTRKLTKITQRKLCSCALSCKNYFLRWPWKFKCIATSETPVNRKILQKHIQLFLLCFIQLLLCFVHLFSILKNICWVLLKLQSIWPLRATVISFHPTMCHTPFLPLAVTRSLSRHLFPAQCDNFELKQQLLCRRGLKSMWRKPVDLVALEVFMAAGQTLGACAFLVRGWAWFKILSCGSLERKCPFLVTARVFCIKSLKSGLMSITVPSNDFPGSMCTQQTSHIFPLPSLFYCGHSVGWQPLPGK